MQLLHGVKAPLVMERYPVIMTNTIIKTVKNIFGIQAAPIKKYVC